jgi:hypothetical protein
MIQLSPARAVHQGQENVDFGAPAYSKNSSKKNITLNSLTRNLPVINHHTVRNKKITNIDGSPLKHRYPQMLDQPGAVPQSSFLRRGSYQPNSYSSRLQHQSSRGQNVKAYFEKEEGEGWEASESKLIVNQGSNFIKLQNDHERELKSQSQLCKLQKPIRNSEGAAAPVPRPLKSPTNLNLSD